MLNVLILDSRDTMYLLYESYSDAPVRDKIAHFNASSIADLVN